ncbi:hypothetical protein E2562_039084 [Oryza meyeriana var. granulata]|uniref:Uncharacterized protein n=1 Tax=Oryza meyeriana var. granulata TaxID=110450 RepID=A0A6G1C2P2_9ORYZ|nr:hypothetical protein E2562_039084 [Oryza meyeriana var. granulata]
MCHPTDRISSDTNTALFVTPTPSQGNSNNKGKTARARVEKENTAAVAVVCSAHLQAAKRQPKVVGQHTVRESRELSAPKGREALELRLLVDDPGLAVVTEDVLSSDPQHTGRLRWLHDDVEHIVGHGAVEGNEDNEILMRPAQASSAKGGKSKTWPRRLNVPRKATKNVLHLV